MGGGSTLRPMGRAAGKIAGSAGIVVVKDGLSAAAGFRPATNTKPAQAFSISSTCSFSPSPPSVAATSPTIGRHHSYHCCSSCSVDEEELAHRGNQFSSRNVFEAVPSEEEAEAAMSALKQIFLPVKVCNVSINEGSTSLALEAVGKPREAFTAEEESDGNASQLHFDKESEYNNLKELHSPGLQNILSLFSLLQMSPYIQRMVLSLSSDKAVWDAVMNNKAVQEVKDSFFSETSRRSVAAYFTEGSDITTTIIKWILDNLKTKIVALVDKIVLLVNELFHSAEREERMTFLPDILKSTFMLTLMVFFVVIVSRIRGA